MIKIDFINDNLYKFDFNEKLLSKKIAKAIFEMEKCPYDFSFSISLVSNKKIRTINRVERGIDKTTDVLSFPNLEYHTPATFKKYVKVVNNNCNKKSNKVKDIVIDISALDMESHTIFLGDIVISYDALLKQAKLYNHSIRREYSFLLTHSLLHLLGYDHIIKKDENKMFKKQSMILDQLKIYR